MWKTAIKVTGSVGVVGLLFSIVIKLLYQQEIITLFGSDRMFYISILIICIIGIAFIFAILNKNKPKDRSSTVVYKDNAKHQGDNRF